MKNSDYPIYPVPYKNEDGTVQHDVYFGLNKREHFTLEIMKSNLTNEINTSVSAISDYLGINKDEYKGIADFNRYIIKLSIDMANQLLTELEKSDS